MIEHDGAGLPDLQTAQFADLEDAIYPMIKPIKLLLMVRERSLPMIVYRLFLADLIIAYVVDRGDRVAYINEDLLTRWSISESELHVRALENLRARTLREIDYVTSGEGAHRLFIFASMDGYDATRLLLTDVLTGWASSVPGNLLIAIPNRDFLIAFSDVDETVLSNIYQQVQLDTVQREHGLTDQLFVLHNGEIREYVWE